MNTIHVKEGLAVDDKGRAIPDGAYNMLVATEDFATLVQKAMHDHFVSTHREPTKLFCRPGHIKRAAHMFQFPTPSTKHVGVTFMGMRVIRSKDLKHHEILVA